MSWSHTEINCNPWDSILDTNTEFSIPARKQFKIGTWFTGLIKAGTFLTERDREFWYVTKYKPFLTIILKNRFYTRIILSTHDNETMKHWIKNKIHPSDQ